MALANTTMHMYSQIIISTEPLYQEILPKQELRTSLPQSKEVPQSTVMAENVFYQTSIHLQHQWKEDCYGIPSGRPKPSQSYLHFTQ